MKLYIDLETIKCTNQEHIDYIVSKIKPHHACKTGESKAKSIASQKDDVIEKTVFNGTYGEIITIGFAVDDNPISSIQRTDKVSEKQILQGFFDALNDFAAIENKSARFLDVKWIGHNLLGFDLRYLYQRCVINNINTYGIKIPADARHGSQYVFDTMTAWSGFGAKTGGSLDAICKVLGLPGKDGFCGADVWGAWEREEYQRIAEYCQDDVRLTREVYKRLTFSNNHADRSKDIIDAQYDSFR